MDLSKYRPGAIIEVEAAQLDAPVRPSAYVEAVKRFGLGTVHAIRREGFRVVWAHTWKALWGWHYDAQELLVEIVIDARVPDDLKARAVDMIERDV